VKAFLRSDFLLTQKFWKRASLLKQLMQNEVLKELDCKHENHFLLQKKIPNTNLQRDAMVIENEFETQL
jgi:hypothetical protein